MLKLKKLGKWKRWEIFQFWTLSSSVRPDPTRSIGHLLQIFSTLFLRYGIEKTTLEHKIGGKLRIVCVREEDKN